MRTDKKIVTYSELLRKISKIRKGKRVVVATGTFDLFHAGHLMFLDYAKRQGDFLIVNVGSDRVVKKYKGNTRPIIPEKLRMTLIAGLDVVDYVVRIDEDPINKFSGYKFFNMIKPDILVVPYRDHNPKGVTDFAKKLGIKLVHNPRIKPGKTKFALSTSDIIKKIKEIK